MSRLARSGYALVARSLSSCTPHLPLPPTLPYAPHSAPVRRHLAILQESLAADPRGAWAIYDALDTSLHGVVPIDAIEVLLRQQVEDGRWDRVEELLRATSRGCLSRDVLQRVARGVERPTAALVDVLWQRCMEAVGARVDLVPLDVRRLYLGSARGDELLRRAEEVATAGGSEQLGGVITREHLGDAPVYTMARLAGCGIKPSEDLLRAVLEDIIRTESLTGTRVALGKLVQRVPGASDVLRTLTGGSHEIAGLLGVRISRGELDKAHVVACLDMLLQLPQQSADARYRTIKTALKVLSRLPPPTDLLPVVFRAIAGITPADNLERVAVNDLALKAAKLLRFAGQDEREQVMATIARDSSPPAVVCLALDACNTRSSEARRAAVALLDDPQYASHGLRFLADCPGVEREVAERLTSLPPSDPKISPLLLRCLPFANDQLVRQLSAALLPCHTLPSNVVLGLCSTTPAVAYHWARKLTRRDDVEPCVRALDERGDEASRVLAADLWHHMQTL